eukprot:CAMPEP_0172587838 /NCGR_PEP_ID=MMETSP1068-20121228/6831_1 /TAXON_ID=35684 /ORGANISM="Pseudopedinella elastica, Strain CCMP716" /LENGTH=120 /DNA_ID=CAMNT_0013382989 /DNA_START=467 /DNA_END=831 /DNA_ORIENTATION=-
MTTPPSPLRPQNALRRGPERGAMSIAMDPVSATHGFATKLLAESSAVVGPALQDEMGAWCAQTAVLLARRKKALVGEDFAKVPEATHTGEENGTADGKGTGRHAPRIYSALAQFALKSPC